MRPLPAGDSSGWSDGPSSADEVIEGARAPRGIFASAQNRSVIFACVVDGLALSDCDLQGNLFRTF
jgi:hypothetical protein